MLTLTPFELDQHHIKIMESNKAALGPNDIKFLVGTKEKLY